MSSDITATHHPPNETDADPLASRFLVSLGSLVRAHGARQRRAELVPLAATAVRSAAQFNRVTGADLTILFLPGSMYVRSQPLRAPRWVCERANALEAAMLHRGCNWLAVHAGVEVSEVIDFADWLDMDQADTRGEAVRWPHLAVSAVSWESLRWATELMPDDRAPDPSGELATAIAELHLALQTPDPARLERLVVDTLLLAQRLVELSQTTSWAALRSLAWPVGSEYESAARAVLSAALAARIVAAATPDTVCARTAAHAALLFAPAGASDEAPPSPAWTTPAEVLRTPGLIQLEPLLASVILGSNRLSDAPAEVPSAPAARGALAHAVAMTRQFVDRMWEAGEEDDSLQATVERYASDPLGRAVGLLLMNATGKLAAGTLVELSGTRLVRLESLLDLGVPGATVVGAEILDRRADDAPAASACLADASSIVRVLDLAPSERCRSDRIGRWGEQYGMQRAAAANDAPQEGLRLLGPLQAPRTPPSSRSPSRRRQSERVSAALARSLQSDRPSFEEVERLLAEVLEEEPLDEEANPLVDPSNSPVEPDDPIQARSPSMRHTAPPPSVVPGEKVADQERSRLATGSFQQAEKALAAGAWQEALEHADATVTLAPDRADYLALQAYAEARAALDRSFASATNVDGLIERLERALVGLEPSGRAYYYRGLLLRLAGKSIAARQSLRRAIELNPEDADAARELAST